MNDYKSFSTSREYTVRLTAVIMHVSRSVLDFEMAIRKLSSRFRHPLQVSRPEWPVISAARPLFYLIRIFGLAPFEISKDHFIPGSYYLVTYSLFCTLIHTYIIYFVLKRFPIFQKGDTSTLNVTETAKAIFNYCVTLFNILATVWTRNEFLRVLDIIKHFDSRIRDLGHPQHVGVAKFLVWSTCVCTALLWTTINRTGMVAFNESWIINMAYIINYMATWLSTIKFSSVVILLGQRFRHLNRVAQRSNESATTKQKYIAIDFKVIQQLHNSLMNAGESLSSQYSWPLLLWLINLCIHSVSDLYFLIVWLIFKTERVTLGWPLAVCISWWFVTCVIQLLLLHIACDFTAAEANSIGSIIINWKSITAVNRNYNVEYLLHLLDRRLNFSAAGCFHVNLPLLRSITGLLTTYLVLLLQFQT